MTADDRQAIHDALVRLADGDRSAFHVLVDRLWPEVLAFTQRSLAHPADGEDAAQEVFLRISTRIAEFDRRRDGVSWAFGIATWEVLTQRKRRTRQRRVVNEPRERRADDEGADEVLHRRRVAAALEAVLGVLSDADRSALGLNEGAPQLGAAARKRRQRALERLRAIWRSIHGEP